MDALLSANDQMEALSRSYVGAITARAGYAVGHAEPDRDSVDLFLQAGGTMRPQIGVQLKATATVVIGQPQFTFALKIKNYNDLRVATQSPRILVVLAMPKNDADWLDHSIERLMLRRCAFWKSLLGMPETGNENTVSITIDTRQVFDVPAITTLMQRSREALPL